MTSQSEGQLRVLLVALFSDRHPAIGESHAISVLGGCVQAAAEPGRVRTQLLDLYAIDTDRHEAFVQAVAVFQPHVLGISCVYGSLPMLEQVYPAIRAAWRDYASGLVVVGGAIATYRPEFLWALDQNIVIVAGEGDDALPAIIDRFRRGRSFEGIPNVLRFGDRTAAPRKLVSMANLPLPDRSLATQVARMGGQVFTETSRGCSWSACTFCNRGLSDLGHASDWRRCRPDRVAADLMQLQQKGVIDVTFADEDFLGPDPIAVEAWVNELASLLSQLPQQGSYYVSAMARSLWSSRWDEATNAACARVWASLRRMGVTKVFLGLESGSSAQLRRFAKGITPNDAVVAITRAQEWGLTVELGFIMFDPLSSLQEVRENCDFLLTNNLQDVVSAIDNELRVQVGSRYERLLEIEEEKRQVPLFKRPPDRATLVYESQYAAPDLAEVVRIVRAWRSGWSDLHYLTKALTRYGSTGATGDESRALRDSLSMMRRAVVTAIRDLTIEVPAFRSSANATARLQASLRRVALEATSTAVRLRSRKMAADRVDLFAAAAARTLAWATTDASSHTDQGAQ